jgi:uncharacterized protein (TIGR02996 family)
VLLTLARMGDLAHPRHHHVRARTLTVGAIEAGACNVVLSDPTVSPIHARIELGDGKIVVEDLGSSTGTRINGELVTGPTEAREGDLIMIGETVLRFSATARAPLPPGVEQELLAALHADPSDDDARMVYADWLEQHDRIPRAELVRLELARDGESTEARGEADARRRALSPSAGKDVRVAISRTEIENCNVDFEVRCPKRWSSLTPTGDSAVRHCSACDKPVHYCVDLDEIRRHARERACVAFDAALVRDHALTPFAPEPKPEAGARAMRMGLIKLTLKL